MALLDRGVAPRASCSTSSPPVSSRSATAGHERSGASPRNMPRRTSASRSSRRSQGGAASRRPDPRHVRGTAVACVDGEWHSLPAKLFAEVIALHGWEVRYLGPGVPGPHLISYFHQYGPDVVAVSCSLPTRLTMAHGTIRAAHEAAVPVLAGGADFGRGARWALRAGSRPGRRQRSRRDRGAGELAVDNGSVPRRAGQFT